MKHQKYKRITLRLLSRTKGLQCLLCSVFLCSSMCSDPMSSPSYTPIDCVWDYGNVSFSDVSLSLPECVEIFGTEGYPPYQTLSEPFIALNMNASSYGELSWCCVNAKCSENTMTAERKQYNSIDDPVELRMIHKMLYEVQIYVRPNNNTTRMTQNEVIGSLFIKVDNVLNTVTGERVSLTWESPEYSGITGFILLNLEKTASVVPYSETMRIYVHNQYVNYDTLSNL